MKTNSIEYINNLIRRYPQLSLCKDNILQACEAIVHTYDLDGKLLCCGNGGSAADCDHIVGELMKGFVLARHLSDSMKAKINDEVLSDCLQNGLAAISLVSHTALSTAFSNDQLPSAVFAQQVLGYGKENDILLCISTSGNSLNCVYAAKVAKAKNMVVISLTGERNSKLSQISDITIKVPAIETYKIQEYHLPVYHAMCLAIENEFFGD